MAIVKTIHIKEGPAAGATVYICDDAYRDLSPEELARRRAQCRADWNRAIARETATYAPRIWGEMTAEEKEAVCSAIDDGNTTIANETIRACYTRLRKKETASGG